MEFIQRVGSSLKACSAGAAPSRCNRTSGSESVRTEAFQQSDRRAEAEDHQASFQDQELRRACENLRAELDSLHKESDSSALRSYDDGPSGFTPTHCGGPPSYRRFYDDGYNDRGGFAA